VPASLQDFCISEQGQAEDGDGKVNKLELQHQVRLFGHKWMFVVVTSWHTKFLAVTSTFNFSLLFFQVP
jgi:hypothetical protein